MKNERMSAIVAADSMAVRMELVARVKSGELTLEEAQAELKRIKREATKRGERTLHQQNADYLRKLRGQR